LRQRYALTLVHVIETGKFVAAWRDYRPPSQLSRWAMIPIRRSAIRISFRRTRNRFQLEPAVLVLDHPYLSVIVTNSQANRLVIDPAGNYFWLSCGTATANAKAARAVPEEGRRSRAHLFVFASLELIRKVGTRFSEKIVLKQKIERDDDSKKSHPALGRLAFDALLLGGHASSCLDMKFDFTRLIPKPNRRNRWRTVGPGPTRPSLLVRDWGSLRLET